MDDFTPEEKSRMALAILVVFTIMMMVLCIFTPSADAANWRNHMSKCNGNKACALEQSRAEDLWNNQAWDDDLKQVCRTHISSSYIKNQDYIGAANCVYALQKSRQEFVATQEYINTQRATQEWLENNHYHNSRRR